MLTNTIITQFIGFAGVAGLFLSFQFNKRSTILVILVSAQIVFIIHFGLLHAWTAVVMNVIAVTRGYIFYLKPNKTWAQHRSWVYIFIALFWLGGLASWEGYHSLLAILGMTIETIGLWKNHPRHIRWYMLGIRPLWFVYNVLVGSYAGIFGDTVVSISLIIGMIRFDRRIKNKLS